MHDFVWRDGRLELTHFDATLRGVASFDAAAFGLAALPESARAALSELLRPIRSEAGDF